MSYKTYVHKYMLVLPADVFLILPTWSYYRFGGSF